MFNVIREIANFNLHNITYTLHSKERTNRKTNCTKIFKVFEVDKGHKNGTEIHVILEDSTVVILNTRTRKLITYLKARPQQLKRYTNKTIPNWLLKLALNNVLQNKNY